MPIPVKGSLQLLSTLAPVVTPDASYSYSLVDVIVTNIGVNPGLVYAYVDNNDLAPDETNKVLSGLLVAPGTTEIIRGVLIGKAEKLIMRSTEANPGNPTTIVARVSGMMYDTTNVSLVSSAARLQANVGTPLHTIPVDPTSAVGNIRVINTNTNNASLSGVTIRSGTTPLSDSDTILKLSLNGGAHDAVPGIVFVPGESIEANSDTSDVIIRVSLLYEYSN